MTLRHVASALLASTLVAAAQTLDTALDNVVQHLSLGWFPKPYAGSTYYYATALNIYQHSRADGIRTAGTRPIGGAWSSHSPFRDSEDDIKKPWSNADADDNFPSTGYSCPTIARGQWNIPVLHSIVRAELMYEMSRERLYWLDTSRRYLSIAGTPTPFREVSVLFNNEHFLGGRIGVLIPVYGAFLRTQPIEIDARRRLTADQLASFYYVGISAQGSVLLLSEATQYVQIADAKSQLRYRNGQDTVTLMNKARLTTAAPLRTFVDVCAGWQVEFGPIAFNVEAYATFPLQSALTDARWMLYRYGVRFALGGTP